MNELGQRILEVLPRHSLAGGVGAKLSSIADCANCSKSQAWRILNKFLEDGFVVRVDLPYRNHFVSRYSSTVEGRIAVQKYINQSYSKIPF